MESWVGKIVCRYVYCGDDRDLAIVLEEKTLPGYYSNGSETIKIKWIVIGENSYRNIKFGNAYQFPSWEYKTFYKLAEEQNDEKEGVETDV